MLRRDYRERYETLTGISLRTCPVCRDGQMLVIEQVPRGANRFGKPRNPSNISYRQGVRGAS